MYTCKKKTKYLKVIYRASENTFRPAKMRISDCQFNVLRL